MAVRSIRLALTVVAIASCLCALALLLLPLMLVLLMLLFDSTAQGVLVLLGTVATWMQTLLPGRGGALPPYRALVVNPLGIALAALARSAPCLGGLLLIVLASGTRRIWAWVLLFWVGAALCGGRLVGLTLLPGLAAAALLAVRPTSTRAPRRSAIPPPS